MRIVATDHRQQREYVEKVAVDIFGSKTAKQEHFRRCKARYNGYLHYIRENNTMRCDANEAFRKSPRNKRNGIDKWPGLRMKK